MSSHCGGCNKPVTGRIITALGKKWHVEHFTCNGCKNPLAGKTFFEKDGAPFCQTCYPTLFSPKCAHCNQPIADKCITALDQSWHPEHFVCTSCKKPFDENDGFHERDNKPYCGSCFGGSGASQCATCNQPISDSYVTALNRQWHSDCFVCQECRKPFSSGTFYEIDGLPFCDHDYHLKKGLICATCKEPVKGRCVTALGQKFHPEHFVCSQCNKQLTKSAFQDHNGSPICGECYQQS